MLGEKARKATHHPSPKQPRRLVNQSTNQGDKTCFIWTVDGEHACLSMAPTSPSILPAGQRASQSIPPSTMSARSPTTLTFFTFPRVAGRLAAWLAPPSSDSSSPVVQCSDRLRGSDFFSMLLSEFVVGWPLNNMDHFFSEKEQHGSMRE